MIPEVLEKLNEIVSQSTETENSTEYMKLLITKAQEIEDVVCRHYNVQKKTKAQKAKVKIGKKETKNEKES